MQRNHHLQQEFIDVVQKLYLQDKQTYMHLNRIWSKYISKMNIKDKTLLFLAEGVAFLLCLAAIYFLVIVGCALVDSCYYYYVPGGGV